MIKIQANFNEVRGRIKPMHAVNNMPTVPTDWGYDLFGKLRDAHVPYSRLHDTGGYFGGAHYVDIPNVFPCFDADENNPKSYDFAFTDALLSEMCANGIKPYYRLGVSIENHQYIKPYHIFPPKDYEKWARICEHVILHYNEGWANGFEMGIEYWEIWNEPDNQPDVKDNVMWKGSMEDYFRPYEVTATHLKKRFPNLKIGGYGSCGFYAINSVDVSKIANSSSRTEYFIEFFLKFLDYARERKLPLDFFSWHSYAGIKDMVEFAEFPRKALDEAGYTGCEIHLNEWNPSFLLRGTAEDAVNVLANMIAMQNAPVDMLMYYDTNVMSPYCGLFNPINHGVFNTYYSFYIFGQLYTLGDQVECYSESDGIYAIAARGEQGAALAVVNSTGKDQKIQLELEGISGKPVRIFSVDKDNAFDETDEELSLLCMSPNSIRLVKFGDF